MNRRRWVVLLVVAITLSLAGGILMLLDGNWLSAMPALSSATVGVFLLGHVRRSGWAPPRPLATWRLAALWVFVLVISAMFAVAAFTTSHTDRRWIAVAMVLFLLAGGGAATVVFRRINSSAGRPE